jgi:monoterpene epsilon-lactone hydrolase
MSTVSTGWTVAVAAAFIALAPGVMAQQTELAPREVPARTLPVPSTVSPQMQKLIAAPLQQNWNSPP